MTTILPNTGGLKWHRNYPFYIYFFNVELELFRCKWVYILDVKFTKSIFLTVCKPTIFFWCLRLLMCLFSNICANIKMRPNRTAAKWILNEWVCGCQFLSSTRSFRMSSSPADNLLSSLHSMPKHIYILLSEIIHHHHNRRPWRLYIVFIYDFELFKEW